jgi:hypothetical protein
MKKKLSAANFLEHFFENCEKQLDLNELENFFVIIEEKNFRFSEFIGLLMETKIWQDDFEQNTSYKDLCLKLALEIECFYMQLEKQPAYHSISHFIDVCFSLSLLRAADFYTVEDLEATTSINQLEDSWILLLCAIGHDYGHDGSFNKTPHQLEKKSLILIQTFLDKQNLELSFKLNLINKIEPIILATDPQSYPLLFLKFSNQNITSLQPIDYLCMLMVEADLLASTLPIRGVVLSKKLSLEWAEHSPLASSDVITKKGRLRFLNYIQFLTKQSKLLGIDKFLELSKELTIEVIQ